MKPIARTTLTVVLAVAAIGWGPQAPAQRRGQVQSSLLLLIDASGSMGDEIGSGNSQVKIEAAKQAAIDALGRAAQGCSVEVAVLAFSGDCQDSVPRYQDFTREIDRLTQFIGSLQPGGGTPMARTTAATSARRSTRLPPEMAVIPGGSFQMGCVSGLDCQGDEKPVREVRVASFELSTYEVTFEEYDRFVAATDRGSPGDQGWGRGRRPVINVSWDDAVACTEWLAAQTGESYRLPSEAEWEYAARAGSARKYGWGNEIGRNRANCDGYGSQWDDKATAPVGSFSPDAFGLHDMHGNLWEWVQDCWNGSYQGAPPDGSAWSSGDCERRVLRGGSWNNQPENLRAANRNRNTTGKRNNNNGFRVARTLASGSRRSQGGAGRAYECPGTVMMKRGGVPLASRERRRGAARCRQDFSSPGQNLLGSRREDLVKQAEHGNKQQADERPDHLVQCVHLRPEPGDLNLETIDLSLHLGPELGDLSLHLRPEIIDLSLHLRPEIIDLRSHLRAELGDLSSDGGDDVLPTQMTYLLDGGMDQLGVRTAVQQDAMDRGGVRFR